MRCFRTQRPSDPAFIDTNYCADPAHHVSHTYESAVHCKNTGVIRGNRFSVQEMTQLSVSFTLMTRINLFSVWLLLGIVAIEIIPMLSIILTAVTKTQFMVLLVSIAAVKSSLTRSWEKCFSRDFTGRGKEFKIKLHFLSLVNGRESFATGCTYISSRDTHFSYLNYPSECYQTLISRYSSGSYSDKLVKVSFWNSR